MNKETNKQFFMAQIMILKAQDFWSCRAFYSMILAYLTFEIQRIQRLMIIRDLECVLGAFIVPKKQSASSEILLQATRATWWEGWEMFNKRKGGFLPQHCSETCRLLPSGKQSSGSISSSANSGICSSSSAGFVKSTVLPSERLISSSLLSTRAKMRKTNWSVTLAGSSWVMIPLTKTPAEATTTETLPCNPQGATPWWQLCLSWDHGLTHQQQLNIQNLLLETKEKQSTER